MDSWLSVVLDTRFIPCSIHRRHMYRETHPAIFQSHSQWFFGAAPQAGTGHDECASGGTNASPSVSKANRSHSASVEASSWASIAIQVHCVTAPRSFRHASSEWGYRSSGASALTESEIQSRIVPGFGRAFLCLDDVRPRDRGQRKVRHRTNTVPDPFQGVGMG